MTGAPIQRLTIDTPRGRASFLALGAGRPVVLVHGLGLSADVWRPHMAALADRGYGVLAPDLPGFGESESGNGRTGHSVPEMAAWLAGFADTLRLPAPAWVGHSISAQFLLRLAAASPARTAALVLAAPTGRPGRHLLRQFTGLIRTAFRERAGLVARVLRQYTRDVVPTIGTWVRARHHDALPDARTVHVPALVVVGGRDPVVPGEFGERLARTLPRGTLKRIEGAAHAVALDPLQPFLDALVEFLAGAYRPLPTRDWWKSAGITSKFHGSSGR